MSELEGRVAVITGAGRGLGRSHALLFAREGAKVVVNDVGAGSDGVGQDVGPAHDVVAEIRAAGGEAVANVDDVASWDGAQKLIETASREFGRLDVLVNNAGNLRDRVIVNLTEQEWDVVTNVHLKGHMAPLHFAAAYWREQSKAGNQVDAAVINTSSAAGLYGNPGQVNYAAAKAGIAAMTIVAARELKRYGVRANAIAPIARTRLTAVSPGVSEQLRPPQDENEFDIWDPANVSPLVAFLATVDCPLNGQVLEVAGGRVNHVQGWIATDRFEKKGRWGIAELREALRGIPTDPAALPF